MEADKNPNNQTIDVVTNSETKVQTPISNDVDIHQKRVKLQDSTDPKEFLITSILIYTSQYYPQTKQLLKNLVDSLLSNN